jgi:hypothetical protein
MGASVCISSVCVTIGVITAELHPLSIKRNNGLVLMKILSFFCKNRAGKRVIGEFISGFLGRL